MARRFTYAEKGKGIATSSTTTQLKHIQAPEIDITQAILDNVQTLIGRVTNPREQKFWNLIPFLTQKWNPKGTITSSELGQHCFQMRFELKEDMESVLANRPYHYMRWMVILQRWEPVISPHFPSQIPFWIRLKGLPLHYWTKDMLDKISNKLGRINDIDLNPTTIRIRVTIDGLQPITKETVIDFSTGEETIVSMEYE